MKKYNHLYKDIELDENLIDIFEEDSMFDLQKYENLSQEPQENSDLEEIEQESDEALEEDDDTPYKSEIFEPIQDGEKTALDNQTTMFMNKYFLL